jgi:hypothetical protein
MGITVQSQTNLKHKQTKKPGRDSTCLVISALRERKRDPDSPRHKSQYLILKIKAKGWWHGSKASGPANKFKPQYCLKNKRVREGQQTMNIHNAIYNIIHTTAICNTYYM